MRRKPSMANIELHLQRSASGKPLIARQLTFNRFKDNLAQRKLFLQRETLKSQRNFANIMSRMENVCYNMVTRYNGDQIIMNNLKQIALNQSKRLGVYMNRLSRVNAALNCHYRERYADRLSKSNDTIDELKRRKKDNDSSLIGSSEGCKSESSRELSYADLSIVQHQSNKHRRDAIELDEYFRKKNKLEILKGEIFLSDQRKKYHVHKTFEKQKVFNQKHFVRQHTKENNYKPYNRYKKGNLYFNKSYKNINLQINNIKSFNNHTDNKEVPKTKHRCNTSQNGKDHSNLTNEFSFSRHKSNATNNVYVSNQFFLSSSPSQISATTTKANSSVNKPRIRLIKTAFYDKGSNDLANHFECASNSSPLSRNKSKNKSRKRMEKLNTAYKEALDKSRNISCDIYSNLTEHEDMKQKFTKFQKVKTTFDLNEIIDEFKLNQHHSSSPRSEEDIVRRNALKVANMLPKEDHVYLWQMVNEVLHEQKVLHKRFDDESGLCKRLLQLKQRKEFQKVCNQTMILKKSYSLRNTVEPEDEVRKIKKIIREINGKVGTSENLQKVLLKLKVMKDIKPLLYNNRIFRTRAKKEKKRTQLIPD